MKLELLADILETTATELASTLKLEDGTEEVSPEIAELEIYEQLSAAKLKAKRTYVKEGEGKAERLFKQSAETKFRELGIEGEKYDDFFGNLSTALEAKPNGDDKETMRINAALKQELEALKTSVSARDAKEIEATKATKTRNLVLSSISTVMDGFTFPSLRSKEIAIDNFISENKFTIDGTDVYLEKNGSPISKFNNEAKEHFSLFGTVKEGERKPKVPKVGTPEYNGDLSELNKQFINAPTLEARTAIKAKIQAHLDSKK